jgi:DnaK suppressor protein
VTTAHSDTLTEAQLAELQADLRRLIVQLDAELEATRAGAAPVDLGLSIGRVSRIDAIQQQKMAEANRSRNERRQRLARAAELRFEGGNYGECQMCFCAISFRRLKARPETALCLRCQEGLDRRDR